MELKGFKEFSKLEENILDDVLNLGSKFLYFWKNKWILNTKHGLERILQRSKLKIDQLKQLFRKAIEKVNTMKTDVGQTFLFYSKSLNQGFISAVGEQGNLNLITFLPPGRSFPKPGTQKVVIESLEGEQLEFENITVVELD